ncbi:MAG TPA: hydrogenase maturation protease [Chthonomonadaceae bacterium]|nr:hydrogenase maturation protease [Chthonomonadaceae bacterium]
MSKALLIGVGNAFRHDDGVGLWVVQEIRKRNIPNLTVLESSGDGAELLDAWQEADTVVLVDATQSGSAPGTLHRLNAREQPLPAYLAPRSSSHLFSIAEAIRMGAILNQLPRCLLLFGIEGRDFSPGCGLSSVVQQTAQELVLTLCTDLPALISR